MEQVKTNIWLFDNFSRGKNFKNGKFKAFVGSLKIDKKGITEPKDNNSA